jgi:hypothetical protein
MSNLLRLALFDIDLSAASLTLDGPSRRFAYCRHGAVAGDVALAPEEGALLPGRAALTGAGRASLYEIAPAHAPLRCDVRLSLVLARCAQAPCAAVFLMRADRIESQADASTPRHYHRGSGIRRLLHGCILADIGGHLDRIDADGAWFETGREAVVGTNVAGAPSAFVRVMAPMAAAPARRRRDGPGRPRPAPARRGRRSPSHGRSACGTRSPTADRPGSADRP